MDTLANREGFIWMDGQLVNWADAKIHVLTHTLHYGLGVFEGVRAYATSDGSKIFRLNDHTKRLFESAKAVNMKIPFSEQEINEAQKEVFRAYDIRGIVQKELSDELIEKLGQAIGTMLIRKKHNALNVCRDGRLSGPHISNLFIKGVLSTGCNVYDLGLGPTPLLYFSTFSTQIKNGVMITGSHNPKNYNGFKIVVDRKPLSGKSITEIRDLIESENFLSGKGIKEEKSLLKTYKNEVKNKINLKKNLKIVLDCGNGAGGSLAPDLFKDLDIELIELFSEVDGDFPNHHPDPGNPKNLKDLIDAVTKNKADLGIALDGDGDRLGVVDNLGNIIFPDQYMALIADEILKENFGRKIVFDVKCSTKLKESIETSGGIPIMARTGHSFIKKEIIKHDAVLGGEMSGHIFFNDDWYGFDDGIYSALRLIEIIADFEESSSDMFNKFPQLVNTPELTLATTDKRKFEIIERLKNEFEFNGYEKVLIDGIRLENQVSWGLARASNTTPSLVFRFEGESEDALLKIVEVFQKALFSIDDKLEIKLN